MMILIAIVYGHSRLAIHSYIGYYAPGSYTELYINLSIILIPKIWPITIDLIQRITVSYIYSYRIYDFLKLISYSLNIATIKGHLATAMFVAKNARNNLLWFFNKVKDSIKLAFKINLGLT